MINSFDTYFYRHINQVWTNETMDFLMFQFSEKTFWIPFYCLVIWLMTRQFQKKTLLILLSIGVLVFATEKITSGILKPSVGRVRPCHEASLTPRLIEGVHCSDTGSMASAHASNHFAIAIFMVLLFGTGKGKNLAFWMLWAFSVGYSRVYLGVHYPSDVIVGAIIGLILGSLGYILYKYLLKWSRWE